MLALFLAAAAVAQPVSGPAMLVISTTNHGLQFVPFSTWARCEAAREMIQRKWAADSKPYEAQGYKPIPGTEPQVLCIAG